MKSKPYFLRTLRRKNRGLTLIEVVSALGIIAVGLVGLLALFPVAIRESARAGDRTTAAILGEYIVEQVRLRQSEIDAADTTAAALSTLGWGDYDHGTGHYTFDADVNPTLGNGYGSGEYLVNGAEDKQALYARYEVTLKLDKVLDEAGNTIDSLTGLRQVTVTIRWPRATTADERERQDTMTFVTFIRPSL